MGSITICLYTPNMPGIMLLKLCFFLCDYPSAWAAGTFFLFVLDFKLIIYNVGILDSFNRSEYFSLA